MAGSNFHQLRFGQGICTRVVPGSEGADRVEHYDCTPEYAKAEKVPLPIITEMKKKGIDTSKLEKMNERVEQ